MFSNKRVENLEMFIYAKLQSWKVVKRCIPPHHGIGTKLFHIEF